MIENSSTSSEHNVSLGFFFMAAAASQRVACAIRFCMHKHKLLENDGRRMLLQIGSNRDQVRQRVLCSLGMKYFLLNHQLNVIGRTTLSTE